MYEDPVVRAERELEELTSLRNEAIGVKPEDETPDTPAASENQEESSPETDDSGQPSQEPKPDVKDAAAQPVDYEARYKSLQGKYNAEVPGLQADRNRLMQENLGLKREVEDFKRQLAEKPKTQEPGSENVEDALDDLAETYGPDFTKALDRYIDKRLADKVPQTTQQPDQTEDPFIVGMNHFAPNWRVQNNDQGFISWLNETRDPFDKHQRSLQEILIEAVHNRDAERAAHIFNVYRPESPARASSQPATDESQTPDKASPSAPSKESLVVPDKRGTGAQTKIDNAKGKVWTMAEINAFYKKAELGRISEKEFEETDAAITLAHREGRIVD